MQENSYRAETHTIEINENQSPIYFVNVWNTEGTEQPDSYVWNSDNLSPAKETIEKTIIGDSILKNQEIAKFVVAFPFGFVIYRWGKGEELPDFNLEKHGEYEFSEKFRNAESPTNAPIFCPLENRIKNLETKIWCDENIKTIRDYYSNQREKLSMKFNNPNKKF